jgi:hypothetical protein
MCDAILSVVVNGIVSAVAGGGMAILGVKYGYSLSIKHEGKMKKQAFRALLYTVIEDLKAATEGNVYYIHSTTLAAIKNGCDGLLENVTPGVAAKLRTLRNQYAQMEDKGFAEENVGWVENMKAGVRTKRDEMVKLLEEILACAK